jgi:tRNA G10  N-methylase Trm11
MDDYRVICARLPGNQLVAAECQNLTGGLPDDEGVALCQQVTRVPQSAYLSLGLRCLAHAASLDELVDQVSRLGLAAERFRVEFLDLTARSTLYKPQAILRMANVIDAYPDLDHPQARFVIVVQAHGLWLGQVLAENARSYLLQDSKPYRTSSSLPSRLARAVVNLVASPAGSLLDPFCGTGSLLLEAAALGLTTYGLDHNPRMVGMSRRNLAHFGYPARVDLGDALHCTQTADALLTDLPYGRLLEVDYAAVQPVLEHLVSLAPRAVYLAGQDLTATLQHAGYARVRPLTVRKHHTFSRFVHVCWRECYS